MNFTIHAKERIQQRGIPKETVEFILEYGTPQPKPGGAIEYSFSKKDKNQVITYLKHLINRVDRITNKGVLIKDGQVITVYHKKQ